MTIDRLRRILRLRLRSLFAGDTVERELDEELRDHIDRQTAANIAGGMTAEQARAAALRAMAGVEQRKEEIRDVRGVAAIDNLARDVRDAGRITASTREQIGQARGREVVEPGRFGNPVPPRATRASHPGQESEGEPAPAPAQNRPRADDDPRSGRRAGRRVSTIKRAG